MLSNCYLFSSVVYKKVTSIIWYLKRLKWHHCKCRSTDVPLSHRGPVDVAGTFALRHTHTLGWLVHFPLIIILIAQLIVLLFLVSLVLVW